MQHAAEPTIALPDPAERLVSIPNIAKAAPPSRKPPRYVPERGLVRRIRTAQANDDIGELATRHSLDQETRALLSAELIKAGAPPITSTVAETALSRLVTFEPLNADALRPFLMLSLDRPLRAAAMARVGDAMRRAGRRVKLISDAVDTRDNPVLIEAGKSLGCGITRYDGSPNCVDILRKTDLACLALIEAGFRAPLDKVALLRLNTLVQATGSEPVFVMRPQDTPLAVALSKIGVRRVVLAVTEARVSLGPVFAALRDANLVVAEILDTRGDEPALRPGRAAELAMLLTE
jgi:hypothetical protein